MELGYPQLWIMNNEPPPPKTRWQKFVQFIKRFINKQI